MPNHLSIPEGDESPIHLCEDNTSETESYLMSPHAQTTQLENLQKLLEESYKNEELLSERLLEMQSTIERAYGAYDECEQTRQNLIHENAQLKLTLNQTKQELESLEALHEKTVIKLNDQMNETNRTKKVVVKQHQEIQHLKDQLNSKQEPDPFFATRHRR